MRLRGVARNGVKLFAAERIHSHPEIAKTAVAWADEIAKAVLDNVREQYRFVRKEPLK